MNKESPVLRILQLLFYLKSPFGHSWNECISAIEISRSTFYEYIKRLKVLGFCIESEFGKYRLDVEKSENEWFTKLFCISEEDAVLFSNAIDKLDISMPKSLCLKKRLLKIFDDGVITQYLNRESGDFIRNQLIEAIKSERQVLLSKYHSGNSQTVSDRLVEPFEMSDSFNLVWCYDIEKKANRQFKISRITDVNPILIGWEHKSLHERMPTDVFRNTGILNKKIEIRLNLRARNLLIEEYPLAERYLHPFVEGCDMLKCKVALYEGPCRFVMGLWDDIELIGDSGFKDFVKNKIENFQKRIF